MVYWPKKHVHYVHSDKDSNWGLQNELGLTDEAMENFKYCCMELEVHMLVSQDGTYKILKVEE